MGEFEGPAGSRLGAGPLKYISSAFHQSCSLIYPSSSPEGSHLYSQNIIPPIPFLEVLNLPPRTLHLRSSRSLSIKRYGTFANLVPVSHKTILSDPVGFELRVVSAVAANAVGLHSESMAAASPLTPFHCLE